jgi:hypothetical protein
LWRDSKEETCKSRPDDESHRFIMVDVTSTSGNSVQLHGTPSWHISGSQFEFWWLFWSRNWHFSFFQPIKFLHFEPNWPPLLMFLLIKILTSIDISLCPTMKKNSLRHTWTTTWDDAIHTIPEDGAAYGVHAALTQSFNMCLSMEDFRFWRILGFPWGSSGWLLLHADHSWRLGSFPRRAQGCVCRSDNKSFMSMRRHWRSVWKIGS